MLGVLLKTECLHLIFNYFSFSRFHPKQKSIINVNYNEKVWNHFVVSDFFVSLYCVNETKAIKQNGKIRKITH